MMSVQIRSRDKFVIGILLSLLSLAAWVSTFYQAQMMVMPSELMRVMEANHLMSHNMHTMGSVFSPLQFLIFLSTWFVMMTAMMLPSAAPMIMTYAAVSRQRHSHHPAYTPTALFILGYLLAWGSVGVLAYAVSTLLSMLAFAIPTLQADAALFGGMVLVLAGAFQFSTLKSKCLSFCRTPLGFILSHWREGQGGALRMGLHHGLYCIGCCWALMAILFVVGIMNLTWMVVLTLFMFIEKVNPRGLIVGRVVGALLILAGMVLAVGSIL